MASDDIASRFNTCLLGTLWLPGVVTFEVTKSGRDIDAQKPKGQNKAYTEDNGDVLREGTITVWTPGVNSPEYLVLQDVLQAISPNSPSASKGPHEIVHPEAENQGIETIQIRSVLPRPPTAKDGYVVKLSWIEYVEKPKPVKKAGTKTAQNVSTLDRQQPLIQPLGATQTTGLSGMDALDAAMAGY